MSTSKSFAGVKHIFCPTDLTAKSQKTLMYAMQMAKVLGAKLTAFHSTIDSWLYQTNGSSIEGVRGIQKEIKEEIIEYLGPESTEIDFDLIVERAPNPAAEIVKLARELKADLIVMKARRGILSALHFGSIVERVISNTGCPVMLMPSRFLAERDPAHKELAFQRVLFDYDFSQATDELFHLANSLTRDYAAELHVLSVLEPPAAKEVKLAMLTHGHSSLERAVRNRLCSAIKSEGSSPLTVPTTVEWGAHAEKVLNYAQTHKIDLVCTALPLPSYYFEKVYRIYLGQLLTSTTCPVLVKQCI
ncbi:MAG TPA: universal stress protein [Pyrinomonadaceae bacterium]|nr:universal stress protein [Pyrinomonadaceae bacterium]